MLEPVDKNLIKGLFKSQSMMGEQIVKQNDNRLARISTQILLSKEFTESKEVILDQKKNLHS